LAGYLERTNPRGTFYMITPAIVDLFEKEVKAQFQGPRLKALEELAKQFAESIRTEKAVVAQSRRAHGAARR
jgi:predicted NAD/FAD-binding protein